MGMLMEKQQGICDPSSSTSTISIYYKSVWKIVIIKFRNRNWMKEKSNNAIILFMLSGNSQNIFFFWIEHCKKMHIYVAVCIQPIYACAIEEYIIIIVCTLICKLAYLRIASYKISLRDHSLFESKIQSNIEIAP